MDDKIRKKIKQEKRCLKDNHQITIIKQIYKPPWSNG